MHAVDTKVVVRLLIGDDADQLERARTLFRYESVWISLTVILEVDWVLRSTYKFKAPDVVAALSGLAGLDSVMIENSAAFEQALRYCEGGLDFADALHVCVTPLGATSTRFDAALVKAAKQLGLAQVRAA